MLQNLTQNRYKNSHRRNFKYQIDTHTLPPLPFVPALLKQKDHKKNPACCPKPTTELFLLRRFRSSLFNFHIQPFQMILQQTNYTFSVSYFKQFPRFADQRIHFPSPFQFRKIFSYRICPQVSKPLFYIIDRIFILYGNHAKAWWYEKSI